MCKLAGCCKVNKMLAHTQHRRFNWVVGCKMEEDEDEEEGYVA
jgi:hypothetical protein